MSIWFRPITLEDCVRLDAGMGGKGTLMQTLGIEISEIGDDYLKATMPAGPAVHNPLGIVHGGANVALAETVASYAANFAVDFEQYYCVGQEINANHLRASRNGVLTATAKPIHLGKRSSVWEIVIHNSAGELTCISRMTAAVVKR
ncbi:PaaI family thioesterase [Shewanella glacialipiscicola]|uniref:Esterase n=1 Tax=Shewanella glacialipiscicola TaxID=614069 RepID=A0ABQ6J156_9GAMM|nr:hotdog fold thioesterase [Shewanella glacialipiscicola]MCL1086986.1 hotdog fold thioesterase [Shewanella glacialipiscicola]MCU7996085.1 hotdog fold thioesterase [Shewanella glacialipiscicola]MCU8027338.1 hotdog fold thioesterase [Shewanella glacialipiscicola]GIU17097.1 esterase [Shewanella glacialipiscicola]GMA80974.1 esterase [Shewanella glacialipiscicola]